MHRIIVAVTGASGMPLASCLIRMLAENAEVELGCIASRGAREVWTHECSQSLDELTRLGSFYWEQDDLAAGPASGSWWRRPAGIIVAPCSMGTLGAIAAGLAANLIQRVAQVALKERLPLVLVPRESPLSSIHLRNMLEISRAGGIIMPFSPGFYLEPQSIGQMLTQFCCRILDQVNIPHGSAFWNP